VFITTKYSRAWNNFPAGASQVIQSNLFLLRHSPFLAGQISIMSYLYKILLPLPAWCLHIKQVHFLCLYCTCSLELNAGKVECTVQPQRSAKSILHLCIQLSLQFHVFNTVKVIPLYCITHPYAHPGSNRFPMRISSPEKRIVIYSWTSTGTYLFFQIFFTYHSSSFCSKS